MDQAKNYEVKITSSAEFRYNTEILEYLILNFSENRVDEIDSKIIKTISSLSKMPQRGAIEPLLQSRAKNYRFVLFKETRNFELKIIYFIDEANTKIFITDFFPTLMNPIKMNKP